MIGLFFLFAVLVAVVVVPVATIAAVKAVGRAFNVMGGASSRPADDAVDARLTRIEEAIDAMALQIDLISRDRRALPAADPTRDRAGIDPGTSEDS